MEASEAGEYQRRPELEKSHPENLFENVANKEIWIRKNINQYRVNEEIKQLVVEANSFIANVLGFLPEVVIVATSPMHTRSIDPRAGGMYLVTTELALDGDEKLLNEATFIGNLHTFYVEENEDDDGKTTLSPIRALIDTGAEEEPFGAGVYRRMIWVDVASSTLVLPGHEDYGPIVKLEESVEETARTYGPEVYNWVSQLIDTLKDHANKDLDKLVQSEQYIIAIEKQKGIETSFIDMLLELIRLHHQFELPHDIHASSYRQNLSAGYIRGPARYFPHVTPSLTIIGDKLVGETNEMRRSLALLIAQGDEVAEIAVRNIHSITKSAPFKK